VGSATPRPTNGSPRQPLAGLHAQPSALAALMPAPAPRRSLAGGPGRRASSIDSARTGLRGPAAPLELDLTRRPSVAVKLPAVGSEEIVNHGLSTQAHTEASPTHTTHPPSLSNAAAVAGLASLQMPALGHRGSQPDLRRTHSSVGPPSSLAKLTASSKSGVGASRPTSSAANPRQASHPHPARPLSHLGLSRPLRPPTVPPLSSDTALCPSAASPAVYSSAVQAVLASKPAPLVAAPREARRQVAYGPQHSAQRAASRASGSTLREMPTPLRVQVTPRSTLPPPNTSFHSAVAAGQRFPIRPSPYPSRTPPNTAPLPANSVSVAFSGLGPFANLPLAVDDTPVSAYVLSRPASRAETTLAAVSRAETRPTGLYPQSNRAAVFSM
jgi:hypothetical protein